MSIMSILFKKKIKVFSLILFFAVFSLQAFEPPPIFSDTTESGIEIYVVNIPQAKDVAIRVYSRGGAWKKEIDKKWLGRIDGFTDYDSICFFATCPNSSLPSAIKIIASTLSKPDFSDSLWQMTREKLSNRLIDKSQINSLFQQTTFAHTPLRFSIDGKLSLFLKLKKENLIDYYKKYFVAENIVVVIAGDINASATKKRIADDFSFLSRKSAAFKPEFKFPAQLTAHWFERHGNVTQSFVCVGAKTFDKMNRAAFDLFLKILKKDTIHTVLTKKNATINNININEHFFIRNKGAFAVSFACKPKTGPRTARDISSWLSNLKNFVWNDDDIKFTSKKMIINLMKKINNPDFIARKVGASVIKFNNPNYFFNTANQWQKTSTAQIQKMCRILFKPDKLNTVILSPDSSKNSSFDSKENKFIFDNELSLLGKVTYPVKYFKLKNNVLLIFHKIPDAPLVKFNFSTIGGLWCETPINNGSFALLGEFMTKCSDDFSPDEFDAVCKNIAFNPGYSVDEQTFSISGECLPKDAVQAAKLLCSSWADPDFDEDFLYDIKKSIDKKVQLQSTNIDDFADYSFRISMFEKMPYRLNKKGSMEFVKNVSIEDIETAYYDFVSPPNSVITVSGNFDEKTIENTVKENLKNFRKKNKSKKFINSPTPFFVNDLPPKLVVRLLQEINFTSTVSRYYYSKNPESLIICGIRVPGFNEKNFPENIVNVFDAAILTELEKLKLNWIDPHFSEIISSFKSTIFQGYNVGWIYAYITVPQSFSLEAKDKLINLFNSVLNMLTDGFKLKEANIRAEQQQNFSFDYINKNKILSHNALFNFKPLDSFIKVDKNDFKKFREIYGKFPITVVVLPTK